MLVINIWFYYDMIPLGEGYKTIKVLLMLCMPFCIPLHILTLAL